VTIGPIDRRGLGETVAWACALVCVTLLCLAELIKKGEIDPMLMGQFFALLTALVARGVEKAGQRSAVQELQAKAKPDTVESTTPVESGKEK